MSEQRDHMLELTGKAERQDGTAAGRDLTLQHITVEYDEITACTMFPQDQDENEISSQWLTATGASFVSLEGYR